MLRSERSLELRQIPTQQKKLKVILRHLLPNFAPGVHYTEKQVNEIFQRFNEGSAYLRRAMIDYRLMPPRQRHLLAHRRR